MRLKRPNSAVAVVASLVVSVSVCLVISPIALAQSQLANMGSTETRVPNVASVAASVRYDTQYKSSNEGVIAFDDGQVTRIQLPPSTLVPAFFAVRAQGDVLLTPKQSATYFVVDGVYSKLNLVWANNKQVSITYMGSVTAERMGTAAAFGAAAPKSVHGSAAKPADVALPVKAMTNDVALAVPSLAIAEVTPLAQQATVPAPTLPSETAKVSPAPVTLKVTLSPADTNIRRGLNKWFKTIGYQDVAWHLPRDIDIERSLSFEGADIESILSALADTQRNTARAVRFCIHPNMVVSAIPVTQFCKDGQ
ncbi:MAG: TcpQ domain-containing protein [Cytophagales bacterium]|nr:TcpQ domain-containing protein [Cytophagales bacterium]